MNAHTGTHHHQQPGTTVTASATAIATNDEAKTNLHQLPQMAKHKFTPEQLEILAP